MTPFPSQFYIAYMLFSGPPFKAPCWGTILDCPEEDFEDVLEAVIDTFRDYRDPPNANTLKVFHNENGAQRDVTDQVVGAWKERIELTQPRSFEWE
jgi:hypothetical protein